MKLQLSRLDAAPNQARLLEVLQGHMRLSHHKALHGLTFRDLLDLQMRRQPERLSQILTTLISKQYFENKGKRQKLLEMGRKTTSTFVDMYKTLSGSTSSLKDDTANQLDSE